MLTTQNIRLLQPLPSIKRMSLCLSLCAGFSLPVFADTALQFSTSNNESHPDKIYLRDGQLRIDTNEQGNWILYDQGQQSMAIVDIQKQEYFLLDEAQVAELGGKLKQVTSQLDAMLASLPPEQRAAAEALMKSQIPGGIGQAAKGITDVETRQTGQSDKIAGVSCNIVETWVDGVQEMELCMAQTSALGLSSGEKATLSSMGDFFSGVMSTVQDSLGDFFPADFSVGSVSEILKMGVPVRLLDPDSSDTAQLESISHNALSDQLFSIPDDYKKTDFSF